MKALASPTPDVSPGLLGFLVVLAIGIALYLLVKSMNKQIRKIEDLPREADLDPRRRPAGEPPADGAENAADDTADDTAGNGAR